MSIETTPKYERRYDIDWLRIIAVFLVFIYHCSRFFDLNDWHVKNNELDLGVTFFFNFLGGIGMPLFFIISGMATFYFLGFANARLYTKARFVRLMIPFLFAVVTQIPIQVYLDRVNHGLFAGSFFKFYPQYFIGLYGYGGNFPWTGFHLWFLILLFVFSLATVLPFVYLRREKNLEKISKFATFFTKPGTLYLLIIPMLLIEVFKPFSILGQFGGYNLFSLLIFYIIGYLIASAKQFKESIEKHVIMAVIIGIISTLLLPIVILFFSNDFLFWLLGLLYAWSWIIVILGLGSKHLNFNHKSRKFLNDIVMPFYILHQTIIVIIGFFIVQLDLIMFLKYIIISSVSFVIVIGLVMIIKKINVLRFLFGMGLKKKRARQEKPIENKVN
ncbi:MAG: acyltransferase family protein [Promethearchaeota archaeon]|jgi:peptidoglycan/LPS O-acetylase OafA/YrhL